jgi:DNA-binding transcriptional LysR family regulator
MFAELFNQGGLSLDRLRSFLLVAQAGAIARAAPDDLVRQSQFSRQIRELEVFFGTELTQRRGKGIVLSPAGKRLAMLIREQLQDLHDFRQEQARQARAFTLGAGGSVLEWLVVPSLAGIRAALGNVTLRTETHRSHSVVEAVREGRVDFGIVRQDAIFAGERKNSTRILQITFHLCVPRRLLPHGTTLKDLARPDLWKRLPFAVGRDGGSLDMTLRENMSAAGVEFSPLYECITIAHVKQLVERGECAGILPNVGMNGIHDSDVMHIEFPLLKQARRTLVLHWNARQMQRRNVDMSVLRRMARELQASAAFAVA